MWIRDESGQLVNATNFEDISCTGRRVLGHTGKCDNDGFPMNVELFIGTPEECVWYRDCIAAKMDQAGLLIEVNGPTKTSPSPDADLVSELMFVLMTADRSAGHAQGCANLSNPTCGCSCWHKDAKRLIKRAEGR